MPERRTADIEHLRELPPELSLLVAESQREGWRFLQRLAEEWRSGANRFDGSGEALFAARLEGGLAGVCGLNVDPYAGSERIGRVRHLYVRPAHRRLGVGRQLVQRVLVRAQARFEVLRLRTENAQAARFYERLGFRRCEGDPLCTHLMRLGEPTRPPESLPSTP